MEPVRIGSALQMPLPPFSVASLVHFFGNPMPERQQGQGVWGTEKMVQSTAPGKACKPLTQQPN